MFTKFSYLSLFCWFLGAQTIQLKRPIEYERLIKRQLLRGYDKSTRPVVTTNSAINVTVGITLFHILETHEQSQTITTLLSVRLTWVDNYLQWSRHQYGNTTQIWVPSSSLWTPDIVIANQADRFDSSGQAMFSTFAIVGYKGDVLWMYPTVVKTYCNLDVQMFPFDLQKCQVRFFSWTFDGSKMDLQVGKAANFYTRDNQEWEVTKIVPKRNVEKYPCCPAPFPDAEFTLFLRRRCAFYVYNLMAPCGVLYVIAIASFFVPIQSGERISLQITTVLAMTVFLMIVGETLPPTPESVPLLSIFYGVTMVTLTVGLIMGVAVSFVYYKKDTGIPPGKKLSRFSRKSLLKDVVKLVGQLKQKLEGHRAPEDRNKDNDTVDHHSSPCRGDEVQLNGAFTYSVKVNAAPDSSAMQSILNVEGHDFDGEHTENDPNDVDEPRSQDWIMLSEKLNTIFFFMFVTGVVGALYLVFSMVPTY